MGLTQEEGSSYGPSGDKTPVLLATCSSRHVRNGGFMGYGMDAEVSWLLVQILFLLGTESCLPGGES